MLYVTQYLGKGHFCEESEKGDLNGVKFVGNLVFISPSSALHWFPKCSC